MLGGVHRGPAFTGGRRSPGAGVHRGPAFTGGRRSAGGGAPGAARQGRRGGRRAPVLGTT